ncbi:CDP-glucose 4,6-dehydratase [Selenomonas sp. AB3002]|uniref:CDP-glucose 4,6-dehydratase n=1 Tax=Selenomonas sp. AB3002 TaxID=1392502 RepID=UPI000496A048
MMDLSFYRGKRILVTGHTGFKGSWLCQILKQAGAEVTGYALEPVTEPNLFQIAGVAEGMTSVIGDVRDFAILRDVFAKAQPEIVLHLAAQPLVIKSYEEPVLTYETNVMGTVNVLECVRQTESVKSFLNVTTDKVYENKEWAWGYRENEPLDGYDPYSNSKSCSELVTHCYKKSFFTDARCAISTARAGNVIGGGDFSANRIVPDCIHAACAGNTIEVRNPYSTRPYQHVLEPLFAYLLIAQAQYEDSTCADWYNVGPDECDCVTTGELVDIFCRQWGDGVNWQNISVEGPHEANFLKLDCSKIKSRLKWRPNWHIKDALRETVAWTKAWQRGEDMAKVMDKQIEDFLGGCNE